MQWEVELMVEDAQACKGLQRIFSTKYVLSGTIFTKSLFVELLQFLANIAWPFVVQPSLNIGKFTFMSQPTKVLILMVSIFDFLSYD